jgi:hypothetical protein
LICDRAMFDLPPLPAFPVTLHTQPGDARGAVERLRAFISEAVAAAIRSVPAASSSAAASGSHRRPRPASSAKKLRVR